MQCSAYNYTDLYDDARFKFMYSHESVIKHEHLINHAIKINFLFFNQK